MKVAQVFVASYHKDFVWLDPMLRSLKRFCAGFIPPCVCVDSEDLSAAKMLASETFPEAQVAVLDGKPDQGFMRAQIAMMSCDLLCPDADLIYLLGSDCLATRLFDPHQFLNANGVPILWYSTYESIIRQGRPEICWRSGTERAMGMPVPREFMRRLPIVYPRELYPEVRAHIEKTHRKPFQDYIYKSDAIHHDTSESNILGAYAHQFMPHLYEWVDISEPAGFHEAVARWDNPVMQFWSHGGMDGICDRSFEYAPGKNTLGKTPKSVISEVLGPTP